MDGWMDVWLTGWEGEFGVFEVEVYDFGEGVDLCDFELADEFCEAFFEFRVWTGC